MSQTLPIEKVTLYDLEQRFNLILETDLAFFSEWQRNLPELTAMEDERLVRIEAAYANLERRSLLENTVKLAILSPLLDLAGFFLPPFYIETELTVEIIEEERDIQLRGRIDVLVLMEKLWLLVIESKRAAFSLKVGIPQALAYMLASPQSKQSGHPTFGLVTNGSSFVFLKLVREQEMTYYAKSKEFILGQDQGLTLTLQIMKQLAIVLQQNSDCS